MNALIRFFRRIVPGTVALAATLPFALAQAATLVVANKGEATASLIDLPSGQVVATLPTGEGPHEVGMSPDGRYALITDYGTRDVANNSLTLIDVPEARVVRTIDLGDYERPHGVEWLDAQRIAVTLEDDKALGVINVETGEIEQLIDTDQEISHMLALAPDRQRAYVTNIGSGSMTVIDLAKGERTRNVPTGDGAEGVAATGSHVWVTNRAADTITVLDVDKLESVAEFPSAGFPIRATATPKGQVLVTRARAGDLVIYDAASFEAVRTVSFDLKSMDVQERLFGDRFGDSSVPIGVITDGSGERAWVAHANADVITEVELASGAILRTLRAGREPDGMGYSVLAVAR